MNREQAKALIRNVFENKFNKDTFVVFIKNLLNEIEDKRFISGRSASIKANGKTIGIVGELHPQVLKHCLSSQFSM